jgi:hypothetical protein
MSNNNEKNEIAPATSPTQEVFTTEKKDAGQEPTLHLEDLPTDIIQTAKWDDLRADAMIAEQAERDLTIKESLRLYTKAVAWSLGISLVIVMEGYDLGSELFTCNTWVRLIDSAGKLDWSAKVSRTIWVLDGGGEWVSTHTCLADRGGAGLDYRLFLVSPVP